MSKRLMCFASVLNCRTSVLVPIHNVRIGTHQLVLQVSFTYQV
uniref:Uncharacterized protein n=1 Tax=Arundo donax TaxID=35708 RepID=A0A0A8ZS76_ARUDO